MSIGNFHGSDLTPADGVRLASLFDRTVNLALGYGWFTHEKLAKLLDAKPASVERMIRYAREDEFGNYVVAKRRVLNGDGLFEYIILAPCSLIPAGAVKAGY